MNDPSYGQRIPMIRFTDDTVLLAESRMVLDKVLNDKENLFREKLDLNSIKAKQML